MSKTTARSRHAGGRPLAFIPVAVVERARVLYKQHRRWAAVLDILVREGNGVWARNTLIRRTSRSATIQNQAASSPAPAARRAARARSNTGDLEAAIERAEYGSPSYHRALAALHASIGPGCGCFSCGTTKKAKR